MKVRCHIDIPHPALEPQFTKLMHAFDLEPASHRNPERPNRFFYQGTVAADPGDLHFKLGNTLNAFGYGEIHSTMYRWDSDDDLWEPTTRDIYDKITLMSMEDEPGKETVH